MHPDSVTPVYAPLRLDDPDAHPWQAACDAVVVGFGAAGACAALEAARGRARVIVAERFEGGGASAKSGGVVYAGGGTSYQAAAGYADTPQAMADYLRQETGGVVSEATLQSFCERSRDMLAWLEDVGVRFAATVPPRKTSYPAQPYYLYYSGNEAVPAYAQHAAPAPRGHRVKGPGMSGRTLYGALRAAVEARAEITVMRQAAARRLIVGKDGAVIGIELWQVPPGRHQRRHARLARLAERLHNAMPGVADLLRQRLLQLELRHAQPVAVRTRAVVLATGGFIFNRTMVARHAGKYLQNWRLGATGCDGSGIRLGESAGAATRHLERVSAWRFINPPFEWARGCVVDAQGTRIGNEETYGATLGHAICERHGGRAWLILNRALARAALRECLGGRLWAFQAVPAAMLLLAGARRASSIEALAGKLGMPPAALRATVDAYSAAARGEIPDPAGKSAPMCASLEAGPWLAIDISANSRVFPCPAITLGGLSVEESSGRVLAVAGGAPISGLYAVGRTAVGIASNHYVSGLSLADCIWSGRNAGRHLTQQPAGERQAHTNEEITHEPTY
ncbi:FAD-binding protein [Cupriavidus oxalaticus]|uniref:3-oxo-5-alpha-steroid 4-dehydrogenase n=1 Tax=Cupriavidus oxalaticus TaxID=96344 RepID=A0A375GGU8_9BURK|nr:FAD-binding protein [Cupriavidus oxalaticus]QRQ84085.1 FAD-binding protein [Cupriavidus oxalaticus]QRQ91826.1 FAD-binding protein [Cupriavidus oxalaticus]WQD86416.1 FAD-binding protein [Cupriavidus oxalaticus]SPC17717.1 3-oxo-5-alpha-steroid 4-dehydrogenase [Cupriavidus oxalaticus]